MAAGAEYPSMNDQNRGMKWALLAGVVGLSILMLYPPNKKLKGGIDLVGGTSLLFEIDTTGLDELGKTDLSNRVMEVLKQRVDPGGTMNLEWRPIGNSRIEIRMPLPPAAALKRRAAYNEAMRVVQDRGLTRADIDFALSMTGEERERELEKLVRNVPSRKAQVEAVKAASDAYRTAQESGTSESAEAARATYEKAISDLLETSLPVKRLEDVLALAPNARAEELKTLAQQFPAYAEGGADSPINKVVAAYDEWAADRAMLEDPSDLKRLLRGAGVLEFGIVAERDESNRDRIKSFGAERLAQPVSTYVEQLLKYGPRYRPGESFRWHEVSNITEFMRELRDVSKFDEVKTASRQIFEKYAGRYYVLAHADPEYVMSARVKDTSKKWKLQTAWADRDPMTGQNVVIFNLDGRGGDLFYDLTSRNVQRQMMILLDDKAMSQATIIEGIRDTCRITGQFSPEDVQYIVRTLEAGALPARLKEQPLAEKTIGPSLGATNRVKGINASIYGGLAVVVFVLIYYGFAAGGVANIALALNVLITLAVMAMMQATFTLPGIAGAILTVGMAIDANVLIFERFREERDRGVPFRKALMTGYDKALSTIIDSNLTTLITCVILGMVSSEEVKGFAIVLGIGLATSMFTALTVTRLIFETLIAKGMLTDFRMRRLIRVPNIDWIVKRHAFWMVSLVIAGGGAALFTFMSSTDPDSVYDIELRGGTSVTVDLKAGQSMTDEELADLITTPNRAGGVSSVDWLTKSADALDRLHAAQQAAVASGVLAEAPAVRGDSINAYRLSWRDVRADGIELGDRDLAALMMPVMADVVERGGVNYQDGAVTFETRPGAMSFEQFTAGIEDAARQARGAAERMRKARVQKVGTLAEEGADPKAAETLSFDITTVETRRELVQSSILGAMGDRLDVQQPLSFEFISDDVLTHAPYFVIQDDYSYVSDVFEDGPQSDLRKYKGGVAIRFRLSDEEQPLRVTDVERRLREVRLRGDSEQFGTREWTVFPIGNPVGEGRYRQFVVAAVDDVIRFSPSEQDQWENLVAKRELDVIREALASEKTLSKIVQFAPQIAAQTEHNTIFAIVLALGAIVAYVWIRFGSVQYGLAATVATVHDVCVVLGAVTVSHFLYNTILGRALGMSDFKIDLPMVAAILTVIGFSLNDTIVIFDRIRENRGKLGTISASLINNSINQTMSRTILTSLTVFFVVATLYIFGGDGIKGFSYALLVGVLVGTYSTLGVAVPMLYSPRVLYGVSFVIGTLCGIGVVIAGIPQGGVRYAGIALVVAFFAVWAYRVLAGGGARPALRSPARA
jgi:SecD/SecF fusion protein